MTEDIVSHSRGADRPRAAAIGLRSMLEVFAPTIPDYALDMYTMKGKAMGAASIIFAAKVRSWCRHRPPMIPTRPKPIGSGRSSSRARKPTRSSHALTDAGCGGVMTSGMRCTRATAERSSR
jgi:hypothetical protein